MRVYLETERLILRECTADDVDNLLELDSDPEVRRYLAMPNPPTRETVVERTLPRFLAYYAQSPHYGFWAAIEKASEAFLGWFHFRPSAQDPDEIELGYRLRKSAWGKGYATEGSKALIYKGFTELNLERIMATTLAENAASRRVMEKAGLKFEKTFFYEGIPQEAVKYGLSREDYEAGRKRDAAGD